MLLLQGERLPFISNLVRLSSDVGQARITPTLRAAIVEAAVRELPARQQCACLRYAGNYDRHDGPPAAGVKNWCPLPSYR